MTIANEMFAAYYYEYRAEDTELPALVCCWLEIRVLAVPEGGAAEETFDYENNLRAYDCYLEYHFHSFALQSMTMYYASH